jgi:hypothetical protein
MKTIDPKVGWTGALGLLVAFVWTMGGMSPVEAQTNPNRTGGGRRPFVMVVFDSSASMEWTEEGDEEYAKRDYTSLQLPDPYPSQPDSYRSSDIEMGVGNGGDLAGEFTQNLADPFGNSNPLMFGSCFVWEPKCSNYQRPSWNPSTQWTPAYDPNNSEMGKRFQNWVRGTQSAYTELRNQYPLGSISGGNVSPLSSDKLNFPVRLLNQSQPRHVTFKEVLTGEMILKPKDLSKPVSQVRKFWLYGPGCWMVPRQRGSTGRSKPICCKKVDASGTCTEGYDSFEQYPDHKEPRPHFQEVFDGQLDNGLMDAMDRQVIFGVASFDSYKWPLDGNDYPDGQKGAIDYQKTVDWGRNGLNDRMSGEFRGFKESATDNYNYGLRRIVAPNTLTIPRSDLSLVSEYTQYAMLDLGTLKPRAPKRASFELDPTRASHPVLDLSMRPGMEQYIGSPTKPYLMSQHPMAGSTPLAPAMYDIQQFFENSTAINQDRFKQCRPKHVIVMTDGTPLPETEPSTSADVKVGEEGLTKFFGVDKDKYDYTWTEEVIRNFVNGSPTGKYLVGSGSSGAKYNPRVHVVGVNVNSNSRSADKAVRKLASMAHAGKTCAGARLENASGTSPWIPDDNGNCIRDDHPCLVPQPQSEHYQYTPFYNPSKQITCKFPSLILQCNGDDLNLSNATATEIADYRACKSSEWYKEAFQRIFNQILRSGGLNSRTRPAFTGNLDAQTNKSGQYRFYSGLNVTGGNPYWKGKLARETRLCPNLSSPSGDNPCSDSNDGWQCFHKDVNEMVEQTGTSGGEATWADNRRIFTSVPTLDVYDLGSNKATPTAQCEWFHSTYKMEESADLGDFQETYLDTSNGSDSHLLNRRVPFEYETLKRALTGQSLTSDSPTTKPLEASGVNLNLNEYFGLQTTTALKNMIDEVRGRMGLKYDGDEPSKGAAFGAVLNSDPVIVDPPSQNVPIESYRQFKSRFADRPSTMYVSTIDGMLHAMYTGKMNDGGSDEQVVVRKKQSPSEAGNLDQTTGTAEEQREAWSYIPQMLHDDFARYQGSNPYLLDGSPVVKDLRLCHAEAKYNQNYQACRSVCDDDSLCSGGDTRCVPPEMQWRSVLVQGLGQAGSGYFALDVTRPGGPYPNETGGQSIQRPDPIPLWEFDPSWEQGQIEHLVETDTLPIEGEQLVYPPSGERSDHNRAQSCSTDASSSDYFWKQPFMGESVGKPALGTVVMDGYQGSGEDIKRPVAVFTAGAFGNEYGTPCDRSLRVGQALYVVDLQTGSILRRFLGYRYNGEWEPFKAEMVGTPALFDNSVGELVTRGFVGDSKGRLFRMDFTSPNPANWEVSLFFDPKEASSLNVSSSADLGPAALKPAVAKSRTSQNLMVVYGLGERRDTSTKGQKQMVMAVEETTSSIDGNQMGKLDWVVSDGSGFKAEEKLTGKPIVFNEHVYFTSYYLRSNNVCALGRSRIWGLELFDTTTSNTGYKTPTGAFDCSKHSNMTCDPKYLESSEPVLIRGASVTLAPSCGLSGATQASGSSYSASSQKKEPQLVAQTGSANFKSSGGNTNIGQQGQVVEHVETNIEAPESQSIPMSWSVITR